MYKYQFLDVMLEYSNLEILQEFADIPDEVIKRNINSSLFLETIDRVLGDVKELQSDYFVQRDRNMEDFQERIQKLKSNNLKQKEQAMEEVATINDYNEFRTFMEKITVEEQLIPVSVKAAVFNDDITDMDSTSGFGGTYKGEVFGLNKKRIMPDKTFDKIDHIHLAFDHKDYNTVGIDGILSQEAEKARLTIKQSTNRHSDIMDVISEVIEELKIVNDLSESKEKLDKIKDNMEDGSEIDISEPRGEDVSETKGE